jgi:hypothetical protein
MKVLLRNHETHLYCGENGGWTANSKQARDFGEMEQAIQFQTAERLSGMEVILSYNDPVCDLVLPLRPQG